MPWAVSRIKHTASVLQYGCLHLESSLGLDGVFCLLSQQELVQNASGVQRDVGYAHACILRLRGAVALRVLQMSVPMEHFMRVYDHFCEYPMTILVNDVHGSPKGMAGCW